MDLTFVTTEQMVEELMKRFDSFIIAGIKNLVDGKTDQHYWNWKGMHTECLGMADILKSKVLIDYNKGDEEEEEEL